ARPEDFGELFLNRFAPYSPIHLLQGERGQCRMTGCAPFVWRDHQLQVRDAFRRYGPYLALKRGARWTEGILLAQQRLVGVPPVSRDCHLNLLRTAYSPFLDLKAERTQGLRGIEGQEQPLWSRSLGDPATPPGA